MRGRHSAAAFEKGRIVEAGTHRSLPEGRGFHQSLFMAQLGEQTI